MAKTVIIYGPQGCGKSRYADALAAKFGCTSIVDPWIGEPLPQGALALTNMEPPYEVQADLVLSAVEAKQRLLGTSVEELEAGQGSR